MSDKKSTVQKRSDWKSEISRALRTGLYQCDMTQKDLADETGVNETTVGNWLNANLPHTPDLAVLGMMRPELAACLYPLLMRCHGYVAVKRIPADATTADHFARFGAIASKAASVTTEYADALRDGIVSDSERRRVRDAIAACHDESGAQLLALDREIAPVRSVRGAA